MNTKTMGNGVAALLCGCLCLAATVAAAEGTKAAGPAKDQPTVATDQAAPVKSPPAATPLPAAENKGDKNSSSPNLVQNGDFAKGKEGWSLARTKDEATIKWDEDAGEGRGKCFKAAATKDKQKLQQKIESPMMDDRLYELSADVNCDTDNTEVSLNTNHGYGVTRYFGSGGKTLPTGKWTRLSIKAMTRTNADGDNRSLLIIEWSNRTAAADAAHLYLANITLKEIRKFDLGRENKQAANLLVNGDFENGLEPWANARLGGFEVSDKGFQGNCALLKADKEQIRGSAQYVTVPNQDALCRLTFKMKPENTNGGKYLIGVMFVFCDMQDRPCGYYFLPLPSKEEGDWLDRICWFFAEKLPTAKGETPAKDMKIKIDFYANPARQDTKEVYSFDNITLMEMEKALQPGAASSAETKDAPPAKATSGSAQSK